MSGLEKLGQYEIIKLLGEGTFGKVKLAVHTLSGQKVALKFINKSTIHAMKVRIRVNREIEYLKMLAHPHIIKLYEVIQTPTDVIMVMEYAGGELFQYIVENGRLPENEARRFFQQIMYGVAHAHSLKVVHRDIKPENVLLDEDLNVKLADFGLSNEMADGMWLTTSCGSPNYAAPEIISGSLYSAEVDVWSCGVILYVLVCGRLPFEDDHVPTLFQKIASGVYHMPKHLSPEVRYLITGMLAVDPMRRLTVPQILAHPWTSEALPPYLRRMRRQLLAPSTIDSLSSILTSVSLKESMDMVPNFGKVQDVVLDELAVRLGVEQTVVRSALAQTGENAVKVAYQLLQDRKDSRHEQDDSDTQSMTAPVWIPAPAPAAVDYGPHIEDEGYFSRGPESEDSDNDDDDSSEEHVELNNFVVLNSSLVGDQPSTPKPLLESHHLASYAASRTAASVRVSSPVPAGMRSPRSRRRGDPGLKQPRWHFGIRSSSPPMEVMLELYRTLQALKIQWRRKKGQWAPVPDEEKASGEEEDGKSKDTDIYYVECRQRVRNVVLLFDLQLYQVDAMNYLVDFRDLGSYPVRTEPGAGPYDRAELPKPSKDEYAHDLRKADGLMSHPLLFLDCACNLILELAGAA